MKSALLGSLSVALFACGNGAGDAAATAPAAPSAVPVAQSASSAMPDKPSGKAPVLARKTTPEEKRKADEAACLGGAVEACRHMADRYRGYGPPAGCGLQRQPPATSIKPSDGPAMNVRVKRTTEDSREDERGYMKWIAKACDLGDGEACDFEKTAPMSFGHVRTQNSADLAERSSPGTSAMMKWYEFVAPAAKYKEFLDTRKSCVKDVYSCQWNLRELYTRIHDSVKESEKKALPADLLEKSKAICESTHDCASVLMMLDKSGYALEAQAPVREHAAKVLTEACLAGDCTCGDAAREISEEDPRVFDLARMGCENGEVEGCYALGRLYEKGIGVAKDERTARALYDIACPPMRSSTWLDGHRQGDFSPRACDRLAEIHEAGEMPPKDARRAKYYAEFACENPGFERDHGPCVRLMRYWVYGVIHSTCIPVGETTCPTEMEEAAAVLFGSKFAPVDGRECQRASVKALCDEYRGELGGKKKK